MDRPAVDGSYLSWPFFDDAHRRMAGELSRWAARELEPLTHGHVDTDATCREIVRRLGAGGWLRYVVPRQYGGLHDGLDVRSLCLARETLGRVSGLADFSFAMQGLGSGPIVLFGSDALKARYLPGVCAGERVAALAVSEPEAGSDVTKTWISNAGIADHYVVFCRLPDDGERSYAAFVVDADAPGLTVSERIELIAPHPLGTLVFDGCRVSGDSLVGTAGKGLRVALGTIDVFRSTVGAAALGFARRALAEAIGYVTGRQVFGQPLADLQLTRAKIADMAVAIDASALLVYRAAWTRDRGAERITREAAMAKLYATEAAQRVIDDAVQLFGGRGVVAGAPVEELYREVRALRIYEGTSEIQRLVIAAAVLGEARD
jgi:acyl-CoA dehydrogenase